MQGVMMHSLFPLIILDTHTNGIIEIEEGVARFPKIVELSAIAFQPDKEVYKLEHFQVFIKNEDLSIPASLPDYNKNLIKDIESGKINSVSLNEAIESFKRWGEEICLLNEKAPGRLYMAGRKVDSFDLPILRYNGFDLSAYNHNCFDVESLFYRSDLNKMPTIYDLKKILNIKNKTASALELCYLAVDILKKVDELRAIELS